MKKLRTLSVLAFMLFAVVGNAKTQTDNDNEVVTTSTEAQVQDEGTKKNAILPQGDWSRKKYFNINFVTSQEPKTSSTFQMGESVNSRAEKDFSIGLTLGRTFYVLKKPILNMIQVGVDWTYIDLTYTKLKKLKKDENDYCDITPYFGDQQAEYSMAVGPSITVNPINYLKVRAYLHYSPTCHAIFNSKKADFVYAGGGQFGLEASWKAIALGFESRWMTTKHKPLSNVEYYDERNNPVINESIEKDKKYKLKNNSFRFFIGFRF